MTVTRPNLREQIDKMIADRDRDREMMDLLRRSNEFHIERRAVWDKDTVGFSVVHRKSGVRSQEVILPREVVVGNDLFVARVVAKLADEAQTLAQVYEGLEGR